MIEMDQLHKVLQFIFQPVMNYNQQKKTKIKDMITCWQWISIWTYRFKKQQFSQTFTLFFFLRTQIYKNEKPISEDALGSNLIMEWYVTTKKKDTEVESIL